MHIFHDIDSHHLYQFLETLPDYYAFARPEWLDYQAEIMNWRWRKASRLYRFEDGQEIYLPLLQKRVGAIPLFKTFFSSFYSYGGLLSAAQISDFQLKAILKEIQPLNVSRLTIYPPPEREQLHRRLLDFGFVGYETFTHILDIDKPFDDIWQQDFTSKNRNMIRKAEKHQLHVCSSDDQDLAKAIDSYYHMYLETVQRWGQARLTPKEHYIALFAHLRSHAKLYLCYKEDTPIGGAIILFGKHNLFYYAGAGLTHYRDLAPTNFLLAEVIRLHCQKYAIFNMGASVGLVNVQKFKESFGAKKIDFHYYVKERF